MRSIYLILKNHFKGEKTMKNFRKLIPAVCMLLLAAVMAGTSTFAWFSMNTTVTAGTMAVSATAPTNLRICATNSTDDSEWSGALSLSGSGLTTMVPVSCDNTNTPLAFYKVKDNGDKIEYDKGAYKEDTTFEAATAGKDYYTTSFWIKAVGKDATNLKLSTIKMNEGGGKKQLDKALRVMAVCGENKFIYEPVADAAATYQAVKSLNDEKPVLGDNIIVSDAASVLAKTVTKTAVEVTIYIWYEGQDPACKSSNTVDMAGTTFTLSFTVNGAGAGA